MYGGGNPAVKLEHRRNWCLDVLLVCKQVQEKQQLAASRPNEHEGEVLGFRTESAEHWLLDASKQMQHVPCMAGR